MLNVSKTLHPFAAWQLELCPRSNILSALIRINIYNALESSSILVSYHHLHAHKEFHVEPLRYAYSKHQGDGMNANRRHLPSGCLCTSEFKFLLTKDTVSPTLIEITVASLLKLYLATCKLHPYQANGCILRYMNSTRVEESIESIAWPSLFQFVQFALA